MNYKQGLDEFRNQNTDTNIYIVDAAFIAAYYNIHKDKAVAMDKTRLEEKNIRSHYTRLITSDIYKLVYDKAFQFIKQYNHD